MRNEIDEKARKVNPGYRTKLNIFEQVRAMAESEVGVYLRARSDASRAKPLE